MKIAGTIAAVAALAGMVAAGTVYHSASPMMRRSAAATSSSYQPPGYAASTLWYDGSWTNASGYIPDLSTSATNYGYPLAGAAQPTPTNLGGQTCWYFDGGDGIMITNEAMETSGYLWTNVTWRVWARRESSGIAYVLSCFDGSVAGGVYYNGGYGVQFYGNALSLGDGALSSWLHIVMTATRSGNTATINAWTNGVHKIVNSTMTVGNTGQSQFSYIGRYYTGAYCLQGYIDEPYVATNTAWTALQVTNDFNSTKSGFGL